MTTLTVLPRYGYGWSLSKISTDVPPPFHLVAAGDFDKSTGSDSKTEIYGKVDDENHPFNGKFVLLTARTLDPPKTYNVRIYSIELRSMEEAKNAEPFATGFAELAE